MAKKNQSTFVKVKEWWVHLRPFNKRMQAKAERKKAKELNEKQKDEYFV